MISPVTSTGSDVKLVKRISTTVIGTAQLRTQLAGLYRQCTAHTDSRKTAHGDRERERGLRGGEVECCATWSTSTTSPPPTAAAAANTAKCPYPHANAPVCALAKSRRTRFDELLVRQVEVDPPHHEEREQPADDDEPEVAERSVEIDRRLHPDGCGQHRLTEHDDREQAVALGDVAGMPRRPPGLTRPRSGSRARSPPARRTPRKPASSGSAQPRAPSRPARPRCRSRSAPRTAALGMLQPRRGSTTRPSPTA